MIDAFTSVVIWLNPHSDISLYLAMPHTEAVGNTSPRRLKRRSSDVVAQDENVKKQRGRPRLEPLDETAQDVGVPTFSLLGFHANGNHRDAERRSDSLR